MSDGSQTFNVETEKADPASVLNYYKWLSDFRKSDTMTRGKRIINLRAVGRDS